MFLGFKKGFVFSFSIHINVPSFKHVNSLHFYNSDYPLTRSKIVWCTIYMHQIHQML